MNTSSGLPWSEEELRIVHDQFPVCTWAELSPMLPGRTRFAVKHQAWKMGLYKTPETRIRCEFYNHGKNAWTKEETERLVTLWTTAPLEAVHAAFPNRTVKSIEQKAVKMALRRPPAEVRRALLKSSKCGCAARQAKAVRVSEAKAVKTAQVDRTYREIEQAITPRKNSALALAAVLSIPLEAAWRGI